MAGTAARWLASLMLAAGNKGQDLRMNHRGGAPPVALPLWIRVSEKRSIPVRRLPFKDINEQ